MMPRKQSQYAVYTKSYHAEFPNIPNISPVYEGDNQQAAFAAASNEIEFLRERGCLPVEGNALKWVYGEMVFDVNYVEVDS